MGIDDVIRGRLTSALRVEEGTPSSFSRYVHPRVDPELGFVLKRRLSGDVTAVQALAVIDATIGSTAAILRASRAFAGRRRAAVRGGGAGCRRSRGCSGSRRLPNGAGSSNTRRRMRARAFRGRRAPADPAAATPASQGWPDRGGKASWRQIRKRPFTNVNGLRPRREGPVVSRRRVRAGCSRVPGCPCRSGRRARTSTSNRPWGCSGFPRSSRRGPRSRSCRCHVEAWACSPW